MKQIIFIVFFFLQVSAIEAQEVKPGVDSLWLSGLDVLTGKSVDIYNLAGHPCMNYFSPESVVCHQDETVTVTFRKYITTQTQLRSFTWRMSPTVQKLIGYAVRNHQWVNIITSGKLETGAQDPNAAITLEPYNFESIDSIGGTVPEKELTAWSVDGMTFPLADKGDIVTSQLCPCLLAVENGTAIIQTEGTSLFPTKEGKAYFTIRNVTPSAMQLLRFAVKNNAVLIVSYDKKTKSVAKLRLDPKWNKPIIIGKN